MAQLRTLFFPFGNQFWILSYLGCELSPKQYYFAFCIGFILGEFFVANVKYLIVLFENFNITYQTPCMLWVLNVLLLIKAHNMRWFSAINERTYIFDAWVLSRVQFLSSSDLWWICSCRNSFWRASLSLMKEWWPRVDTIEKWELGVPVVSFLGREVGE